MGEEEITGKLERFMEEQKLFRGVVVWGVKSAESKFSAGQTAMNMFIILVVMVMMIVLEQSERVQDSN